MQVKGWRGSEDNMREGEEAAQGEDGATNVKDGEEGAATTSTVGEEASMRVGRR